MGENRKIIDLTFTIDNQCMTCGTPWHEKVDIKQMGNINDVGRNTHSIKLGSHTATHIDAPLHFIDKAIGIDKLDLLRLCGNVTIVDFSYINKGQVVGLKDVQGLKVTERMLFRFYWYKKWMTSEYYKQFPYFQEEAMDYLIENGMKLIALDTPSPDCGDSISELDDSPIHKKLLEKGIIIIEYLNNTEEIQMDKDYQIIALPLKIRNVDGSPARIILAEKEGELNG
jgi:arylformamidase